MCESRLVFRNLSLTVVFDSHRKYVLYVSFQLIVGVTRDISIITVVDIA